MTDRVQLALALSGNPDYSRETFLLGESNQQAFSIVDRWPDWPTAVTILVGARGSGKSHLAAIWAEKSGATTVHGNELADAFVVGSNMVVDNISAGAVPEQALFHAINSARETNQSLLLVSQEPPSMWAVGLPDLESRLREASLVRLHSPDEMLLRPLLVKHFADRQLLIDQAVLDYAIVRMERSFAAAEDLVRQLDERALAEGRRISRGLVADVLNEAQDR